MDKKICTRNRFRERLSKKILDFDSYATPISFNFSNGSNMYSTGLGAFLSIFVMLITFTYLGSNMNVMVTNKGSSVFTSATDSAFTYKDTITSKDGFRIAFGLDTRWGAEENISDYL